MTALCVWVVDFELEEYRVDKLVSSFSHSCEVKIEKALCDFCICAFI